MSKTTPSSSHRNLKAILWLPLLTALAHGPIAPLDTTAHEFGTKTWEYTYDSGAGTDIGDSIRFDSQGRIAVAGWIPTTGDLQDALVFQITPGESDVNWDVERNVTGSLRDRFYNMAIDSTDSIICTGVTAKGSYPYSQPLTEKFFPDGTTDWQEIWHPSPVGGTEAFATGVAINADDEAFTSTYYDIGSHNYILWGVRKYVTTGPGTYTGTLETAYSYDNGSATGSYSYSNRIEGIALDDAGGVCTVGRIGSGPYQTRIWHVRRYGLSEDASPVPELKWSHTLPAEGSGFNGMARRVAIDANGNPVVVGAVTHSTGVWTGRIVKYNNEPEAGTTNGVPAWTVEKLTPKTSFYNAVNVDRMGYYWASGYYTDADDNFYGTLVRLDPADGTILNELIWAGIYPRAFDIRDRRLAVCLYAEADIKVELYTPDPPEITLSAPPVVEIEVHSPYTEPGFSSYDAFEREDLTSAVAVTDLPDVDTVGSYTVRYNVDAHNGDSAVEQTRMVNIVDTTAPEITLEGNAEIRVDAGVPYIEPGFTVSDNYESGLEGSVVVEGAVDTSTPGSYELTYRVSDSSGNPATAVRRLVRVEPLVIATVEIVTGEDVRITADTQAGASYRIMESSNLQVWQELAVVATPSGQLDWTGSLSGDNTFVRIERVVN